MKGRMHCAGFTSSLNVEAVENAITNGVKGTDMSPEIYMSQKVDNSYYSTDLSLALQ